VSLHKCRHCGEDIRSRRLWLPRPAGEPFWLPPPFETEYVGLDDGSQYCRLGGTFYLDELDGLVVVPPSVQALHHQPMPRVGA